MKRYETIPVEDIAEFLAGCCCKVCPRKKECDLIDFDCWDPVKWLAYLNEEVSDEKTIINILSADKKYAMRYNTKTTEMTIFRVNDLKTMLHVESTGLPLRMLKANILDRFDYFRADILEGRKWHDVRR